MIKKLGIITLALFIVLSNNLLFATSNDTCFDTDTVLMLHANGSDADTTFTDSSGTPKTITANGNSQVDTAQFKFGGSSALFDGANSYLTTADSNDWNFGTNNFTIDFWVRFNSLATIETLVEQNDGSGNNLWRIRRTLTDINFIVISAGVTIINITGTWTPVTNTWYHVAAVRGWGGNANDFAVTVDGVATATGTDTDSVPDFSASLIVGRRNSDSDQYLDGWMDELRIVKGTAVWTSNFTAPSAEYSTCSDPRRKCIMVN